MTRIITEGFLDYPFHLTLKPYVYQTERYPQCLAVLNEMMAKAYLASRNALVVEHEGQVIAVALMHDRPIGFWRNVVSGGYRLFRYASPLLVADFAQASYDGDQIAIDNGDFEYIPVKLIKSLASQTIPLLKGYNAAVLELEGNRLVFHYSDIAGQLNPQCIVSTEDGVYNTDHAILDNIKQHKQQPNYMIGIAIHHDGSPITEEEVKQMGIY